MLETETGRVRPSCQRAVERNIEELRHAVVSSDWHARESRQVILWWIYSMELSRSWPGRFCSEALAMGVEGGQFEKKSSLCSSGRGCFGNVPWTPPPPPTPVLQPLPPFCIPRTIISSGRGVCPCLGTSISMSNLDRRRGGDERWHKAGRPEGIAPPLMSKSGNKMGRCVTSHTWSQRAVDKERLSSRNLDPEHS